MELEELHRSLKRLENKRDNYFEKDDYSRHTGDRGYQDILGDIEEIEGEIEELEKNRL